MPAPSRLIGQWPWLLAALLSVWGIVLVLQEPLLEPAPAAEGGLDFELYRAIIERMRTGAGYYEAAAAELRRPREPAGLSYPTASVFNWRLPTLAWLLSTLPRDASRWLLAGLAAAALGCWWRAGVGQPRLVQIGTVAALATGLLHCLPGFLDDALVVHETWAGVLLALGLGAGAAGQRRLAMVAILAAGLIRELAWLAPAVLLVMPFADAGPSARRERFAWALVLLLCLAAWTGHVLHVQQLILPTDRAHQGSWIALGGWRFVLKTAHMHPLALPLLPTAPWVLAALLPWLLALTLRWYEPRGRPACWVLLAYVAAYLVVGQPFNFLWGLVYVPLLGLGVAALLERIASRSAAAGLERRPEAR
ncbi:MAG TPA: hypothetical protein PKD86_16155 [Gemmatales bacterium]|nr:hypothetical protein [Gemmatales bacterium]HMP60879.1 hypothetical protein [Gemmatales bacterium]